jgi:hypothetical protein
LFVLFILTKLANTICTNMKTDFDNIYKNTLTICNYCVSILFRLDSDALQPGEISRSSDQATDQDAVGEVTEIDTGGSGDSGQLPPSPFDIVPLNCPDDFLIMYPVMSGENF